MKSLPFALMLLLRIASGLSEQYAPNVEFLPTSVPPSFTCQFLLANCPEGKECPRDIYSYLIQLYARRTWFGKSLYKCWDLLPNCTDEDRNFVGPFAGINKNSFLFMKLHPVLNRAADPNLINVPTRYRRIGVRLGSEFLGKRNTHEPEARDRRAPGTELLGKRWGSEMLGKRNWDLVLRKRDVELLGKRSTEFLGKRGTELLGKRGLEFFGKRGNEFLGKRGTEFLGKRSIADYPDFQELKLRMCKIEECNVKWDPRLYVPEVDFPRHPLPRRQQLPKPGADYPDVSKSFISNRKVIEVGQEQTGPYLSPRHVSDSFGTNVIN